MIHEVTKNEIFQLKEILVSQFGQVIENDPFIHYVVYEDTKIKGILSYSLMYDRMELNYIWVDDFYRKQGIGSQLLTYMHEIGRKNQVQNISLEVACNNAPAIHLYKQFGYEIKAIREKYYHGIDGFLMVKEMIK